jgi:hypothetical protein
VDTGAGLEDWEKEKLVDSAQIRTLDRPARSLVPKPLHYPVCGGKKIRIRRFSEERKLPNQLN